MLSGGELCSVGLVRCIDCQCSSNLVDVVGADLSPAAFLISTLAIRNIRWKVPAERSLGEAY